MSAKILIVEDEAIVAQDVAYLLEDQGYTIVGISDTADAAIALAVDSQPDLALMDIEIKGDRDGIAAAHELCQMGIAVVFVTAYADTATLERAKAAIPFGYVIKPFKLQDLKVTIEIALSRHRADQEIQRALAVAQAQRQANDAEELRKQEYLSMAAHEFRTPLSTIKFAAEALQVYHDRLTPDLYQRSLERISKAADNMNALLEDVLTLGRTESSDTAFNPQMLDVVNFCRELLENFQVSHGETHVLRFQVQGACLPVPVDEQLLWHLLNNLISNAIKYSPAGGEVSLTLSYDPSYLQFEVRDCGIGIPPESLQRLFEAFHRANNVGKIPGTGLGLAIVKRAVDLHRGEVMVDSVVGEGTTFTVRLPIKSDSD